MFSGRRVGNYEQLMPHSILTYAHRACFLHWFFGQNTLASRSFEIVLFACEVVARVCCVVFALASMEIPGSSLGMTMGEYQCPNPGYEFVSGFLRWLKIVLVLVLCLLGSFSHGKIS